MTGVSAHPDLQEAKGEVLLATPPAFAFAGETAAAAMTPMRIAAPFERLRDAADAAKARDGARPRVVLVAVGAPAAHGRRVGFARDLFAAGGIEARVEAGVADAGEAAARFAASGAAMACLCGSDEAYRECAESFAAALKKAGARHLVLAGKAGTNETAWRAAGVDDFIFAGGDALAALQRSFRRLGVTA